MRYTIKKLKIITDVNKGIQKLADLEDIEEELGIELITLFKALKNGIYDNKGAYIKGGELYLQLCIETKRIHALGSNKDYYFNKYGIEWALTKGELI